MSNSFQLKSRTRKLVLGIGLALGVLATPLLQTSQAATGVALDVNQALRIDGGAGASDSYKKSVAVRDKNVVEVSTVLHNAERAESGKVAKDAKLRVILPKGEVTTARPNSEALASNLAPRAPYNTQDSTEITSANGQSFSIGKNIRSFKVQRNNIADPNEAKFNWDAGSSIPDSRVDIAESDRYYTITVTPNADGNLDPCFGKAVKISFLVDINQTVAAGSTIAIDKKVRKTGETTFVDANRAKIGDGMQYFVEARNTGNAAATNFVLRDALPAGAALVPGSITYRTNGNPTLRPLEDNFVNGGLRYANFGAGAWVQVYFKVTVTDVAQNKACPAWFKNFALVKTDQTNGSEFFDSVRTDVECVPTPVTTPTPTPCVDLNTLSIFGAAGETVTVTATNYSKTVTIGANGLARIDKELPAGAYKVSYKNQTKEGSFAQICQEQNVTFVETQVCTAKASLKVVLYFDRNRNGVRDNGDSDKANNSVTVTGPNGFTRTAQSDAQGIVRLTGLEAGTYTVVEAVPAGHTAAPSASQTVNVTAVNVTECQEIVITFANQPTTTSTTTTPTPTPTPSVDKSSETPFGNLPTTGTSALATLLVSTVLGGTYLYRREQAGL